jgi:hypothetical protein
MSSMGGAVSSESIRGQMRARTTEELIRLVKFESADYSEIALTEARNELETRQVSPSDYAAAESAQKDAVRERGDAAVAPLSWGLRLLLIGLPVGIVIAFVVAEGFRHRGEFQKARQAMICGLFWPALAGLIAIAALVRVVVLGR